MNYTIHQLYVFLKVVKEKSITKAAEALFMSQPAVSIQLKNFQNQFEIPLYEVIGRQLYITEFGHEVAHSAGRVVAELEDINYKTAAYKGMVTGRLMVSSASTGKYVIPYFLSGFLTLHPDIDLILDVTNKSKVVQSLKQNETDFAFVSVPPDHVDIEEEQLIDNKLYLVSNESIPNRDKPLIYREDGSATRMAMEQYFGTHKAKERKKLELTSNEAVKQAVVAGLGNSIMPLIGIRNEILNKELYIGPAKGLPIITKWRLIWLKGKRLSPVAQAYLDYVRSHKARILTEHFDWYLKF